MQAWEPETPCNSRAQARRLCGLAMNPSSDTLQLTEPGYTQAGTAGETRCRCLRLKAEIANGSLAWTRAAVLSSAAQRGA